MADFGNVLGWLQVGATVLEIAGNRTAGKAAETMGYRTALSKEWEAYQLEQQATAEFAHSQRLALEEDRQARYVASRAIAVAGASGGGVEDITVLNLVGRIKSEGAYRAALKLYEGEETARRMRLSARAAEMEGLDAIAEGKYKKKAYQLESIGDFASGASNLYARYAVPNSLEID